jgi:hypothetical protein
MTARKSATRPVSSRHFRGERVKDEVYRQMFLLEESRPGAEMGLALALLRAWLAADSIPASDKERDWLRKVSIASGWQCASLCSVSSLRNSLRSEQADFRENQLSLIYAGIYWY